MCQRVVTGDSYIIYFDVYLFIYLFIYGVALIIVLIHFFVIWAPRLSRPLGKLPVGENK